MTAAIAIIAVASFVGGMWLFGVAGAATAAILTANGAVTVMRDPGLDERARETAIQRASLRLLAGFVSILIRGLAALALSLLPIWFADAIGIATARGVFEFLARWDVMIATSGAMVVGYLAWRRLWPSS